MSAAPASPNMSENIRSYGQEHGVFGADEIRRIHGQKAALLCSRLARKGQFTRIKNGVYSMLDDPAAQDKAYEQYLERIAANRAADAEGEDAKIIDQLIVWMIEQGSATCAEASRHFDRDMKGWFGSYKKRGLFKAEGNGRYSYVGEKPADRRETRPSVIPTKIERDNILYSLNVIPRMSAKQIGEQIARQICQGICDEIDGKNEISPVRLKDMLEALVEEGIVIRYEPISTTAKATYSLKKDFMPTAFGNLPQEMLAALAMTASNGGMSARRLATHHLGNDTNTFPLMEARGLVDRSGEDEEFGGANFVVTDFGVKVLDSYEWEWRGLPAFAHRPVHKAILALSERKSGTGIAEIREDTGATRFIAEMAVTQLKDEGLIKVVGKPLTITRIQK